MFDSFIPAQADGRSLPLIPRGRNLAVMISDPKPDADRAKEVKVKIPVSYHVRLHSMKVLTGKPISDTVTEALQEYFSAHPMRSPDGEF